MSGQASQEDQRLPSLYFYTNETCGEKWEKAVRLILRILYTKGCKDKSLKELTSSGTNYGVLQA